MLELRIPRRLESPNKSRGFHWRTRHRISQEWEQEIAYAPRLTLRGTRGLIGKVRVIIERHVPSKRNFIRDTDNLVFCAKPALDSLKRLGYIKDDSQTWLEFPTPTQHVSADGSDYTVIRIEPVK